MTLRGLTHAASTEHETAAAVLAAGAAVATAGVFSVVGTDDGTLVRILPASELERERDDQEETE
jgi:hypothetical protein